MNRVQLDFGATIINEHPITEGDVHILVSDAKSMIAEENEAIAQGHDPHDLNFDTSRLFRPLPGAGRSDDNDSSWKARVKDKRVGQTAKTNKMMRVVMEVDADSKGSNKGAAKKSRKSQEKSLSSVGDQNQSRSCVILWRQMDKDKLLWHGFPLLVCVFRESIFAEQDSYQFPAVNCQS